MNVVRNNDVFVMKIEDSFHCVCCKLHNQDIFVIKTLPELIDHLQEHSDSGDLVPTETFELLKKDMEKQIARLENKNHLIFAICLVCGVFAITYLFFQTPLTPEDVIFSIVVLVSLLMVVFLS